MSNFPIFALNLRFSNNKKHPILALIAHFGLTFDDEIFPQKAAAEGSLYLGKKGLLRWFEGFLGLEGHVERLEHIRVEQYRQALARYLKLPESSEAFFRRSFEADALACAQNLLDRRDELLLGGWDFRQDAGLPTRLAVLAHVENAFLVDETGQSKLVKGYADRFEAVLQKLPEQKLPFSQLFINEPEPLLPPQYQRLFNVLRHSGVAILNIHGDANADDTPSDLGLFKRFLSNKTPLGQKLKYQNDGSLILIESERDTEAADFFARILGLNPHFKPVFLIPDRTRVLDDALIHNGLPSLGLPSASLGRPTLQLLKLVTTFLWRPLDPYKVLEFVTLQTKPLDADLANIIANLIAQRPGIGSDQWYFETKRFFENLYEKAATDANINVAKIKAQYDFWFDRVTYDQTRSAPKDEIIGIFNYLRTWASDEFEQSGNKNTSLIVLSEQARRIEEYLNELPPSDNFLSHLALERIIRTIYEPAPVQPTPVQVHHYPFVAHGENLLVPAQSVVWWNFRDTEGVHFFSRWYKDELAYLAQNGVLLTSPQQENALMLWQRTQPVLMSEKRLILVYPKKINGESAAEHPLLSHLKACFDNFEAHIFKISDAEKAQNLRKFFKIPQITTLEKHTLGKIKPVIEIYSSQLKERAEETLTSLETLFYYPHQWVFRHKAQLRKSPILSIVKENTLKGNLAHRFFELVLKEDFATWQRADVDKWVDEHSRRLFAREGATLLMYGFEPNRVQFVRQLKYAIWTLIDLIRRNNWQVAATEHNLEGQLSGAAVKGKADVVLLRGQEQCVLDLKWSGYNYRERLIKNAEDLQLVMYSRLLSGDWAHTAYFIMENARLVARNNLAFKEARALMNDVDAFDINASIWEKMEKTYAWRMSQILRGVIEIRTAQTAHELEEHYGTELLDVLEMKNEDSKFDDYRTLIGLVS